MWIPRPYAILGLWMLLVALPTQPASHVSNPSATAAPLRLAPAVWTPVRATVYYPSGAPMYSGERIPVRYRLRGRRYRLIAVSHDLLARYGLQDTILVRGDSLDPYWDPSLNGCYIIKDVMNARFRRRVDILSRRGHERDIGLWRAHIISLQELRHHDLSRTSPTRH